MTGDPGILKASDSLVYFRAQYRGKPDVLRTHTPFGFFDDGYNAGRHAEHVATGRWLTDCGACRGPEPEPETQP